MRWNNDDGTLDLGLKGGNVTLQLGQELVQPVKHATNGGLDNGKVVYITGSSGDNKTVLYARANDEATSANTLGLMTETVTGGNKGFCTTFGLVRNINTSNLTEGGAVWLSKDTAGAMTAVRPEAPNNGVFIGFCVRKHASTGVIFVNVQNGYELEELHNVYAPSPTNGQVLTYVSGNSRWEAATVADQSATNELQTLSVATNTATLSNSGGSVTIAGGGINTVGTAGSTITVTGTEVDGSVTNEIQQIDTFSLSGQTLRASLSNDNQAAKTVTLPVVGITAGTNVTVSSTGGDFTINASGGAPAGSTGQIQYSNAGAFGASSNLFWDNANGRLGVGTNAPALTLDVNGTARIQNSAQLATTSGAVIINTTTDDGVNKLQVSGGTLLRGAGTTLFVQNSSSQNILRARDDGVILLGNSTNRPLLFPASAISTPSISGTALQISLDNSSARTTTGFDFLITSGTRDYTSGNVDVLRLTNAFTPTSGSGTMNIFALNPTINQTGGASGITRGLHVNPTLTAASNWRSIEWSNSAGYGIYGSGTAPNYMAGNTSIGVVSASARLDVKSGGNSSSTDISNFENSDGTDILRIRSDGKNTYWATNTAAGTTGVQTINRPSGTINIAAGESSKDVNNSLCTTSSIVFAVVRTNDTTAYIKNVVPGAGSFTINLGAAATTETSVGFFVIN
jgi:hypothetical protein